MGMTTCENHKSATVDKLCCHVCFQEAVAERDQLRVYADQLKAKMEKNDAAYDLLAEKSDRYRIALQHIEGTAGRDNAHLNWLWVQNEAREALRPA